MTKIGDSRLREIERVTKAMREPIKRLLISNAANLSYFEVYAAMISAIEESARHSAEDIRKNADAVTAKYGPQAPAA